MKHLLTILSLFAALATSAQVNNIYANAGVAQTIGPPTFVPGARGSVVAIDTLTGLWWVNPNRLSGTAWIKMGHTMREISGCSAPSGAPTKFQSWLVSNTCTTPSTYLWDGSAWDCLNCGGGGGGTVTTDATLDGDGSGGDPLKIAQQSATASKVLEWTGATWEPSWGNPHIYTTTGASITTAVNEVLIGTVAANITMGLPTCDATTAGKIFKFVRNGTDAFSMTIEPGGVQQFYPAIDRIIQFGATSVDCTCSLVGGTYFWFNDKF